MKSTYVLLAICLLSGCGVFFRDPISWYWNHGNFPSWEGMKIEDTSGRTNMINHIPLIARFQKPNTIGHTDSEQRWKDAEACGVKRMENNRISFEFESSNYIYASKFIDLCKCMKSKGYFHQGSCDQSKCNL